MSSAAPKGKGKKKKKTKLSQKGKQKLIEHRAKKLFEEQQLQREKDGNEKKNKEDQLKEYLDNEQELARLQEVVAKQIEEEEAAAKHAKLMKRQQRMNNANKMGQITDSAAAQQQQEIEESLQGHYDEEFKQQELHVDEPVECVRTALEVSLMGKVPLLQYLSDPATLHDFATVDTRLLVASVSADFFHRQSILQVRTEMLWRLATTLCDFPLGNMVVNLKLALRCYELLIEVCDPFDHPMEYAALEHSRDLAQIEHDKVELAAQLEKANDPSAYDLNTVCKRRNIRHMREVGRFTFWGQKQSSNNSSDTPNQTAQ